jgi:hypothetical protein
MGIKHKKRSPIDDDGIPDGEVKPSDWNDDHDVDGLLGALVALAATPGVVPYLDASAAGGTFPISDFVRGIVNGANAAAVLASLGGAPLNSPGLTGSPTAPTPTGGDASTKIATTAFVAAAIASVIAAAPAALDTLNELATALGNDANFAATVTNSLALKAPLNSPGLTGAPTAPTVTAGDSSTKLATTAFVAAALASGVTSLGGQSGALTLLGGALAGAVLTVLRYDAAQALTAAQQKQARANLGASIGIPDVIIEDQKPTGTDAGAATTGSYLTRTLNTFVRNNGSIASLASNQFTLPAGTYYIRWSAPGFATDRHQTRLQNVTDGAAVAYGATSQAAQSVGNVIRSEGGTVVTIAASKTFELQHRFETASATYGQGRGSPFGVGVEVYARVEIMALS